MEKEQLESIRNKTLKGLELAVTLDGGKLTKNILDVIINSYSEIFLPKPKENNKEQEPNENNEEDTRVRFLIDELSYYMQKIV